MGTTESREGPTVYSLRVLRMGIPIGVVENSFECQDALERIRDEADILIPAHDPEVLARYPGGIIA